MLRKLEECRAAAVALQDVTNRTQKASRFVDHTAGCAPHTYQQLLVREEHDRSAALSDPNLVALETK